jgi:histidinol-phosphate aminotransferase
MSIERDILERIPPHIRGLKGYVPGKTIEEVVATYQPDRISKLASNENRWGFAPGVSEAVARAIQVANNYPSALANHLRASLSTKLSCTQEQLVIGAGSESLLGLLCRTFFGPNDEIVTSSATFVGLNIQAHIHQIPVIQVPLTPDYRFDVGAIAASVNERTRAVYIANPNNPTGTIITKQELAMLMSSLPEQVMLILDEAYVEFARENPLYPDSLPIITQANTSIHPNTLILRTFSKAYGLASFRVGYALGPAELIQALWKTKNTFEPSGISEAAAISALEVDHFLINSVQQTQHARQDFEAFLAHHEIPYVPSSANFVMLLAPDEAQALRITESLLRMGVIVRQLSPFGISNGIRITVGLKEEMAHLKQALKKCWTTG